MKLERNLDRDGVRDLLSFYVEAGVDAAVGEIPNEFLPKPCGDGAESRQAEGEATALARIATQAPNQGPVPRSGAFPATERQKAAPPALDAAVMAAREAARQAATLEELRAILDNFEGCALKSTATQLVFADGNPQAPLMLVGEAPGYEEDRLGLPFVGRSGKLLDRMLAAIGLDRSKVYIANIVPWRPPGNRTPTPQEAEICLPFVRRQIELCDPEILVCLGGPSAQTLLGIKEGIMKARGRWLAYHTGKREIRAMATFHPAYLLRTPLAKRHAWRDLLAIKKALAEVTGA
ncbi:MAG TPA: uracil-DNA glycosylase [Xanthobacteraceae bacterium]|nr:uracil-DNA glycosylase [Xanthobacteraceae bacterium]